MTGPTYALACLADAEADIATLRTRLAVIDARHHPDSDGDCAHCWHRWPCPDHQTIHAEEAA